MTRNICLNAAICGSHICIVEPSEFDSIKVGPLSRPSTDTLSRQPSASIMGMGISPANFLLVVLLVVEGGEQAIDQGLRGALIGHRLEQLCQSLGTQMRGDFGIPRQHVAQARFSGDGLLACGL